MTAKNKFKLLYNSAGVSNGLTLQQISENEKITPERVRQILNRALNKMSTHCKVHDIKFEDMLSATHETDHIISQS